MKWVLSVLLVASLAGCLHGPGLGPEPAECSDPCTTSSPPDGMMSIRGVVMSASVHPVDGALVSLDNGMRQTTASDGKYVFADLPEGSYQVRVEGPEGQVFEYVANPDDEARWVVLDTNAPASPYQQSFPYQGHMQCAHEALIISGSCDTILNYGNDAIEEETGERPAPEPLETENQMFLEIAPNWHTLVFDISFDSSNHPGLAGLRTVLRGPDDNDDLNSYQQFGRWHDASSFSFFVEPEGNYTGGDLAIPASQTLFELEILPHSHGYYATCDQGACLLGAGAGVDVAFEVIVTAFYNAPAPAGFSTLP